MKAWALYHKYNQRMPLGSVITEHYELVVSIVPNEIQEAYERTLRDYPLEYGVVELDTDTGEAYVLDSA